MDIYLHTFGFYMDCHLKIENSCLEQTHGNMVFLEIDF